MLIREEAEGIDTFEENRNLVLTDGCQADSYPTWRSRPVRSRAPGTPRRPAGSTTSSCSTCARVASPKEARRLVVHGFFNDLIRKIGVPALEESLVADGRG